MIKEDKEWIDNASYEDLLRRNRHAPLGDRIFLGETGQYFCTSLKSKYPGDAEHTATSKRIGW